jgi:hypothetical protein
MKRLSVLVGVFCVLVLLSSGAFALEIQVSPQTLALSSNSGQFTVHTDTPFGMAEDVSLTVDGTVLVVRVFADDCGNLVAQCSKESVKGVIGEFEGKTTTATVVLTVDGISDQEIICVKK